MPGYPFSLFTFEFSQKLFAGSALSREILFSTFFDNTIYLWVLPLRVDPIMTVRPSLTQEGSYPSLDIPAPDVTMLELIHALFWELSFFGTPEQRDAMSEELC